MSPDSLPEFHKSPEPRACTSELDSQSDDRVETMVYGEMEEKDDLFDLL